MAPQESTSVVKTDEVIELVRQNERMRIALQNIKSYAVNAVVGGWRQHVLDMANNGLGK